MSRPWSGCRCYTTGFDQRQWGSVLESINSRPLFNVVFFVMKLVGRIFLVISIAILIAVGYTYYKFTKNNKASDIKIFFTPGTDCEKNIIAAINKADKMEIAIYSITNPVITNSIIFAHNRGAKIRIIADRIQAKSKGSLIAKIKSSGIPVLTNKKHKIEHNKFAIFDDIRIVSGSYNWTTNASKYNSENCVFFNQPNREYSKRFDYLWHIYGE